MGEGRSVGLLSEASDNDDNNSSLANDGEGQGVPLVQSPVASTEEAHEHAEEGESGGADHDDVDMGR